MRAFAIPCSWMVAFVLVAACGGDGGGDGGGPSACEPAFLEVRGWPHPPPRLAVDATLQPRVSSYGPFEARSSDEGVASVTLEGDGLRVEGRSPGTARITLQSTCGLTEELDLEVVAIDRMDLRVLLEEAPSTFPVDVPRALAPAGATLLPGAMLFLRAMPLDADGRRLDGALDPRWASSDPGVAVVPFGPVTDGRATVSWYEGHAPVTLSTRGATFDLGFATDRPADMLAVIDVLVREPLARLGLVEASAENPDEDDSRAKLAVLPYDVDGRLLLGPNPRAPWAESGDEAVLSVSGPTLLNNSGIPTYDLLGLQAGFTTLELGTRGASATLEVAVVR